MWGIFDYLKKKTRNLACSFTPGSCQTSFKTERLLWMVSSSVDELHSRVSVLQLSGDSTELLIFLLVTSKMLLVLLFVFQMTATPFFQYLWK
jgi:hypothetical protein